jgi:hypothetical protein
MHISFKIKKTKRQKELPEFENQEFSKMARSLQKNPPSTKQQELISFK